MGQRGPAPAPAALKVLRGEDHKDRIAKAPASQDPPDRPSGMTPGAVKVWDAILAATAATAHIGQSHAQALRQYAELTVTINEMQPKGSKQWCDLVLVHLRLARELCLTPATSSSLYVKPVNERKLDRYVKAG